MGTITGSAGAVAPAAAEQDGEYRYAAFISYRHAPADRRWAIWLHRALETYRVPRRLRHDEKLPPQVGRCFRDEEELSAAANLSAEIDEALRASRSLIVVCSPRTPGSEWVNREVERFREWGRHDRILALLIEGEPADSFPKALVEIRRTVTDARGLTRREIERVEPLAADVRPSPGERRGHVHRMAKLRLAAEVLGVAFDDLRQREQERRVRGLAAAGGALAALVLVLAGLAAALVVQRNEAAAQRTDALAQRAAADRLRSAADADRREAKRQLADVFTRDGLARLAAGDAPEAALWFVKALEAEAAAGESARERLTRIRIGQAFAQSPRRVVGNSGHNYPDLGIRGGRWVRSEGNRIEVRRAADNTPVGPPLQLDEEVRGAALTADGAGIIALGRRAARVWDVATRGPLTPPLEYGGDLVEGWFSPDGTRLITRTDTEAVRVWDLATGRPLTPPLGHDDIIQDLKFSSDGTLLATTDGKRVRLWDPNSGEPLTPPLEHADDVLEFAISPEGFTVATVTLKGAHIWDAVTGNPVVSIPAREDFGVDHVALSPDGSSIATVVHGTVHVRDIDTGAPLVPPMNHEFQVSFVAFDPTGRWLLTAGADGAGGAGAAQVWDTTDGARRTAPLPHPSEVTFAQLSPDGSRLLTVCDDAARVWDADADADRPLTPLIAHEAPLYGAAFTPDGAGVVTASDGGVAVWEVAAPTPVRVFRQDEGVAGARFTPDGARVLTSGYGGKPHVWDAATAQLLASPPVAKSLAFSPDGTRLLVPDGENATRVCDGITGQPLSPSAAHGSAVRCADFSSDGNRVLVGTYGEVQILNAMTGRTVAPPMSVADEGSVTAAAFSADGMRVAVATPRLVTVWNATTGQSLPPRIKVGDSIEAVAFSPDGTRLVTASGRWARIWSTSTGQPTAVAMEHKDRVTAAQFSPDGALVVTASWAGARVWDAASGRPVTDVFNHKYFTQLRDAAFSPDGGRVITAGSDSTARVWDVSPDDRPLADLAAHAELLSCRRIDESRLIVSLTADEWQARWNLLRAKYPEQFRPRPAMPITTAPAE